jgi:hypothetical protein
VQARQAYYHLERVSLRGIRAVALLAVVLVGFILLGCLLYGVMAFVHAVSEAVRGN